MTTTETAPQQAANGKPPGQPRLAAALAALQAELPEIRKSETGKIEGQNKEGRVFSYEYQYADLASVSRAVMPLLGRHGLAFTARPTRAGGEFVLAYSLLHSSGEREDGEYLLPDPLRTKPQQVGSAITYARRYCLCAVTGVAPEGDDDDAAAAETVPVARTRQPSRSQAPPASVSTGTAQRRQRAPERPTPAAPAAATEPTTALALEAIAPSGLPPLPGEEDVADAAGEDASDVDKREHGTATRGKGGQLTVLWTVLQQVFGFEAGQKDQARSVAEHIIGRDLPGTTGDLSYNEAAAVLDTLANWQATAEKRGEHPRDVMIAVMAESEGTGA